MGDDTRRDGGRRGYLGLIGFLALCFGVAAVGGAITARTVDTWYPTLDKPWFTPPDGLFGPMWTLLYAGMAVAGWRVWRRAGDDRVPSALALFKVQLALNLGWSVLFFGARAVGWALADIVGLLALILATLAAFWRIDRVAGLLFVPYAAWVGYAAVLNAAIWAMN